MVDRVVSHTASEEPSEQVGSKDSDSVVDRTFTR